MVKEDLIVTNNREERGKLIATSETAAAHPRAASCGVLRFNPHSAL